MRPFGSHYTTEPHKLCVLLYMTKHRKSEILSQPQQQVCLASYKYPLAASRFKKCVKGEMRLLAITVNVVLH